MRVIVICEGLAGSGAVANVAWQQALGLSHQQPVCLISDGLSPERLRQRGARQGRLQLCLVKVPGFTALRRFAHLPRQLLWILQAVRATQRELQGSRTAVICHSHPLAAAVAWWFGKRVRLVMVSHGDIFHRPPGSYDPSITWLYRRTTAYAHRRAAVSVALSPVMVERIQAHGVPSERIALIPNGIDPAEIGLKTPVSTPAEHWHQRPLRLLFVGRFDAVKGLDVLLEAMLIVQQARVEVRLEIVGTATERRKQELLQLAKNLHVENLVHWIGPIPRKDLFRQYVHCHVVIVPSIDDPLPTVVLEAMACGRPVIGSSVGGINYLVAANETGLLVPPNNPRLLAEAITKLDTDRPWLAKAGLESTIRSGEFEWQKTAKKLIHLL